MKLFSYNGQMEFQKLNDECIRTNYQHKHVVETYKNLIQDKNVLDAGCWTGTLEGEIVREGVKCELVGTDINSDALEVARKAFPQFSFVNVDLANLAEEVANKYRKNFDTIFILDVIEHVPAGSEVKVLKALRLMLKPEGALVLSTMNSHPVNFVDPAWFLGHRHYTTQQMTSLLLESGFRIEKLDLIGNLMWDLDILMLYIYKHIFHRSWHTPTWVFQRILKGLGSHQAIPTRIYLVAKSND